MSTIPSELTAPIIFLRTFKDLYIEDEKLKGWEKIAHDFEFVSLSPLYRPFAYKLAERLSFILRFIINKKPSEFLLQSFKVNVQIIEGDNLVENFNRKTGEFELVPEYYFYDESLPMSENDKSKLWEEFQMMLNRFVSICSDFGFLVESKIQDKLINQFVQFEIEDTPLIYFGSRDNLYKAMIGEIDEARFSTLKIEIVTTLGQTAYILNRIKDSGKLPIIEKLVNAGAFWKGKKLTWANIRKNKSDFINDDKKIETRTIIDEKIDGLLALI